MRRMLRRAAIACCLSLTAVSAADARAPTPWWRTPWKTVSFAAAPPEVQRGLLRGWGTCGFSAREIARVATVDVFPLPGSRRRVFQASTSDPSSARFGGNTIQGLCAANATISWVWFPTRRGHYRMFQTRDGGLFRGPQGYVLVDNACPPPGGDWHNWPGNRRILIWSATTQRFQQITRCMTDSDLAVWINARHFQNRWHRRLTAGRDAQVP